MDNNVILREAQERDLPAILEILNHHILHTTVIYNYNTKSLLEMKDWFLEKQNLKFPILVAELDNDVVGYGTFGQFRPHEAYRYCIEHSVYVSPDFQGKGIGKQLILKLITLAKQRDCHNMVAGIDAENKFSIQFHKNLGFQEVGYLKEVGYKFDRWLDLVFLQLNL
ncbi:phosphinothricin acetyltransferase [Mesonia phycicola]|uniref:Phosphinothricin acetyltransferase n=1 Tax=Mesonia phycicola TaxID=579105 RepID=A0A1M6ATP9_9FLAO|nr:GNAT family N-acetyltransferase [Mesonia phycicola]SHI39899.1 phosphinothricin acetyltransferase [Mesonia phycicola]